MRNWLIVHSLETFEEVSKQMMDNSSVIGFDNSTYNAKNIAPGDRIVYYFSKFSVIKGLYQVKLKPWIGIQHWSSEYQIDIQPIIELKEPCDFKELIPSLELFEGSKRWSGKIQGPNAIRELSEHDFFTLENHVAHKKRLESGIEQEYANIESNKILETEKVSISKLRIGQGIFKNSLLNKYKGCKICGFDCEMLLIASHIKPWKDSNNNERLNDDNGFLLCPHHDAVFDKGLIAFSDDGKIMISSLLNDKNKTLVNINHNIVIKIEEQQRKYIKWHRDNIFKK